MALTLMGYIAPSGSKNEKAGTRQLRESAFLNALIANMLTLYCRASAGCGPIALCPASVHAI